MLCLSEAVCDFATRVIIIQCNCNLSTNRVTSPLQLTQQASYGLDPASLNLSLICLSLYHIIFHFIFLIISAYLTFFVYSTNYFYKLAERNKNNFGYVHVLLGFKSSREDVSIILYLFIIITTIIYNLCICLCRRWWYAHKSVGSSESQRASNSL